MSQETNPTALATLSKIDETIRDIPSKLAGLSVSDSIKEKLMELASLTSGEVKGVEGAPQRFRVNEVRLRQPISSSKSIPDDCKPGQLYSTSSKLLGDSVQFIPVLRHAQRKKWLEDSKLDCISIDGVTGTRYGKCKECPYSAYEKGKPMACSSGHTFFVVTPDLSAIYRMDFQKSSAKAGQNILRLTEPPALWGKIFTLSTEHKSTAGRNYYSFATRATGQKPSAEVMEVCDVLHEFFDAQYRRALLRMHNPGLGGVDPEFAQGDSTDVVIDAADDGATIDFKGTL